MAHMCFQRGLSGKASSTRGSACEAETPHFTSWRSTSSCSGGSAEARWGSSKERIVEGALYDNGAIDAYGVLL